jgi:hypothetical protein
MTGVGLWLVIGCANEVGSDSAQSQVRLGGTTAPNDPRLGSTGPTADGGVADNPTISPRAMASGYLLHRQSIVAPWCGVVLLDPSTALTAAHCVDEGSTGNLSVGFGGVGAGPTYAVSAIRLHPLYQQGKPAMHDIARLTLSQPVRDVPQVAPVTWIAPHEDVSVVSYTFVAAGHSGDRRVFDGSADSVPDGELSAVFANADTNCHGESGAGLFRLSADSSSSELLGIASSGNYDPPHPLYPACLGRLVFASVAANLDIIAPQF